ncbi:hypothetical protein KS664_003057 [Clostridium perfringens]|nr:hypothetical protein [Clostridium perfringens]
MKDIQYKSRLACNKAITYLYSNDMQNSIRKDIGLPKVIDKNVSLSNFKNDIPIIIHNSKYKPV